MTTHRDTPTPGLADEDFVEDYQWFRSFRMTDTRIAAVMGITPAALQKRCHRAGILTGCPPHITAQLNRLITAGRPFDISDFPAHIDPHQLGAALSTAHRAGHITATGTRHHPLHRSRITVYRPTHAAVPPEPGTPP